MTRILALAFLAFFFIAPPALAAGPSFVQSSGGGTTVTQGSSSGGGTTVTGGGTLFNPLGPNANLNTFITNILTLVTDVIGPIVVVFMVVYSGFLYVMARGNPGAVGKAHLALLWTVVGGLVLLGAKAIQLLIVATVQGLSG